MTSKREEIQKELNITNSDTYKNQVVDFIKDVVCNYYNESKEVYEIKSRRVDNVRIRHTAAYLCSINIKVGPSWLCKKFNCDHSSIVHCIKKIKDYLQFDRDYKKEIQEIQNIISHKGKMVGGKMNLDSDFYYVNLNDVTTVLLPNGGAIAFSNLKQSTIDVVCTALAVKEKPVKHYDTGLYILKKIVSEQTEGQDNTNTRSRV